MSLKKSRENFEYGFQARSEEHPYKNNFKPRNRKTHLKTYTEDYKHGSKEVDDTWGLMENLN